MAYPFLTCTILWVQVRKHICRSRGRTVKSPTLICILHWISSQQWRIWSDVFWQLQGTDEDDSNAVSVAPERFPLPDDWSKMPALLVAGLFLAQHEKLICRATLFGTLWNFVCGLCAHTLKKEQSWPFTLRQKRLIAFWREHAQTPSGR